MKVGFSFAFDPPAGWPEFKEGNAIGFRGPQDEELLISANSIAGAGTEDGFQKLLHRMTRNAVDTMQETIEESALTVTLPLQKGFNKAGLEVWEIHACTPDNLTLFFQATVVAPDGVMLVTLEAPNVSSASRDFGVVLDSVYTTPAMLEG